MQLIRRTALLAKTRGAVWFAVNVDNAKIRSAAAQNQLTRTLALAQELGGEVVLTADLDVAQGILRVARQKGVEQVILGKSASTFFSRTPSTIGKVLKQNSGFDLVVLHTGRKQNGGIANLLNRTLLRRSDLLSYAYAVTAVAVLTILNLFLKPQIGTNAVLLVYFLAILILSLRLSQNAVFLAAGLAALAWNYFFITPLYTLHIERLDDTILFFLFFAVAFIAARLRTQRETGMIREEKLSFLYNVASRMNRAYGLEEIVRMVTEDMRILFNANSAVYIVNEAGALETMPKARAAQPNEDELKAAKLAFRLQKPVGNDSGVYAQLGTLFVPLKTKEGVLGVIGVQFLDSKPVAPDQMTLLHTLINQLAVMVHREMLLDTAQKIKTSEQIDNLYNTLLNLITHEIRTPIAIIKGTLATLENPGLTNGDREREDLFKEAVNASDRLNRLIENLVDMSRIESGKLKLNLDWCDIAEIVNAAARDIGAEFPESKIEISNESDYLLRADFNLMEKVFYILIRNSFIHNLQIRNLTVKVTVRSNTQKLLIAVGDNGTGLPETQEKHLFAKFSRGSDAVDGLGIGLSVVKGILESHGASIRYEKRIGARFLIQFKLTPENTRPFQLSL